MPKKIKSKLALKNGRKNPGSAGGTSSGATSRALTTSSRRGVGARMGPVSAIITAPVAIGNSIMGAKPAITPTKEGVVCVGRDFMFSPIGSGSVQTWTVIGGTPLAPAAFSDSYIRQYMQLYQKFRWISCTVHYITSSSTASTGDVVFYYGKNRDSVFLNQTSPQFLPFVMSDENTVLGPQWTNHSARLSMVPSWRTTDYGMTDSINDHSAGEIFLLSKTSTTDSPGYVIFDYVVEFAEIQITPRLLSLPLPRAQYSQANLGNTSASVTTSTAFGLANTGNNLSGTSSTLPSGCSNGDIYKVIFDVTNSASGSWVNVTPSNALRTDEQGGYISITVQDGTTLYAVFNGSNFDFYPNTTGAFAQGNVMYWGVSATVTCNIQCWLSLVGTVSTTNINPNF